MAPYFLRERLSARYRVTMASVFCRRPVVMRNSTPLVSFAFDDFPRSAYRTAGAILKKRGLAGSYYASLGLMDQTTKVGEIFGLRDLVELVEDGHELGCHTYDHCHAWTTRPAVFEESILRNREALAKLLPTATFRSLSHPYSCPRPAIKRRTAKYFTCCRGGSRNPINCDSADLNNLTGFFLEKCRGDFRLVQDILNENRRILGWTILTTHDVSESPTQYGCTPGFFEAAVDYALSSGARILPVVCAAEAIGRAD
jgi:peptidoglycan/xylan/chitin deacetylase (PgdA/CDA1 family)